MPHIPKTLYFTCEIIDFIAYFMGIRFLGMPKNLIIVNESSKFTFSFEIKCNYSKNDLFLGENIYFSVADFQGHY